jgi:hypothetical protein
MAFNGSGTFVRSFSWANDATNGILVRSDRMDSEDNGFASGLSNTICKDGQSTTTAVIKFAFGIQTSDGLAATPAQSFVSESSTGFFRVSAGNLGVSVLGSQIATFNSNGLDNTAIGVGTPSSGSFTTGAFSGNISVNTNKFTVNATNGDTAIAGILAVTSDFSINTNKFNVTAASGNTAIAGTLAVTGATTLTGGIVGTAVVGNATAGNVGEVISATFSNTSAPTTTQWGDMTSINLTAGDWDVTFQLHLAANGATINTAQMGISSTTGNSSAGLVTGDNLISIVPATTTYDTSSSIVAFRININGTTTYYAKTNLNYSVAIPKLYGRISARRVR